MMAWVEGNGWGGEFGASEETKKSKQEHGFQGLGDSRSAVFGTVSDLDRKEDSDAV